jgi:hypothetical protein
VISNKARIRLKAINCVLSVAALVTYPVIGLAVVDPLFVSLITEFNKTAGRDAISFVCGISHLLIFIALIMCCAVSIWRFIEITDSNKSSW